MFLRIQYKFQATSSSNEYHNKSCQFEQGMECLSLSEKTDVFGAFKIIKMWAERIINYRERMDRVFCTVKKNDSASD